MICSTRYASPLGEIVLAADGNRLTGLWFTGQLYFAQGLTGEIGENDRHPVLLQTKNWLDAYFDGRRPAIDSLPLAPQGSAFRQAVWHILQAIPYGDVITYGEIARRIAAATGKAHMSAQAVGGAVGHNPLSIIIPCHRVVGALGDLTGYAGGLSRKIWLLAHEGVDITRFRLPGDLKAALPL